MMNVTISLIALAGVATVVGIFTSRPWLRRIAVAFLASIAIYTVLFTMEDMRAHASEAKEAGRSPDFIAGMAERDQKTLPRRVVIFFSVVGLALLASSGTRTKR
ncbi:MAG: hypothetical protein ACREPD_10950 [Stenotrophomonas sp.]|uniref:hypothetical protein n=1 Tax=Stenotrophomonas sp. TaxID=69392 RepID=UPI003D6D8825